jgi:hypothetical protein
MGRLLAASASGDRAEFLAAAGSRLKNPMLLRMALDGLNQALTRVDSAYEPLTWVRLSTLRAAARAALADLEGDLNDVAGAVNDLVDVLDHVTKDHSPLDWARVQLVLASALRTMGEAADCEQAFDQAVACHERAMTVFAGQSALIEGPIAMHGRAQCLIRSAELRGDLGALRRAETALRADLAASNPAKDPVAWAVRQLGFARLYEARATLSGRDAAEDRAAAQALAAALDVFAEHGLRTLADTAAQGLERLRTRSSRRRIQGV